ncbi:hypothetical protein GALL_380410 [mine drainage metagenome]|jgi:hypothetical protein|uniref:Transmembrane protein n=1 Tax=mine drainage metagenome TaxID=410659 RepID=A0A1J5Q972_9ZZZZ
MSSRSRTHLHKLGSIYRPRLAWYALLTLIAWLAPPSLGVPAGIVLGLKVIYWIYTFPRFETGASFSLRCVGLSPRAIARLHGAGLVLGLTLIALGRVGRHEAPLWIGSSIIFAASEAAFWLHEADGRDRLSTQRQRA